MLYRGASISENKSFLGNGTVEFELKLSYDPDDLEPRQPPPIIGDHCREENRLDHKKSFYRIVGEAQKVATAKVTIVEELINP